MTESQLELLHERYELRVNLLELGDRLDSGVEGIGIVHHRLLEEQFEAMAEYYLTLCERIRLSS
jgi:hypothetical protein